MTDEVKKTLTKVVISEINKTVSKKSSGTVVASIERVIPIIVIEPFTQ